MTESTALVGKQAEVARGIGTEILARAQAITVMDETTKEEANVFFLRIRDARKEVQAIYKPHLDRALEAKRAAEATRKGLADELAIMERPLIEAEGYLKGEIGEYLRVKAAEDERKRQEAAEARRKEEEEARLQAAVEAEAAGAPEIAEGLLSIPEPAPEPPAPSAKPKAKEDGLAGMAWVETWTFEVTNIRALAKAVADGIVPADAILPNPQVIRSAVTGMREAFRWPGVQAIKKRELRAAGRR